MAGFENKYGEETKQRFGQTTAYKEYKQKTESYTEDKWKNVNDGLMAIFSKFARCMNNGNSVDSDNTQALVKELQEYISDNYYTCTKEILLGLGQMYVCDERFKNNIDKTAPGTAQFVSEAIKEYCK